MFQTSWCTAAWSMANSHSLISSLSLFLLFLILPRKRWHQLKENHFCFQKKKKKKKAAFPGSMSMRCFEETIRASAAHESVLLHKLPSPLSGTGSWVWVRRESIVLLPWFSYSVPLAKYQQQVHKYELQKNGIKSKNKLPIWMYISDTSVCSIYSLILCEWVIWTCM